MSFDLYTGDCRDVMRTLSENSVDSIVTDPPYGLQFMGKSWDHAVPGVEFWREMLRVAKPGAHLLAFGGTRTFHRMVCAIEDAGWEIRDRILWLYGSGFPKSRNLRGEHQGWGTALKPAHEPIVVARKPLIGTVGANVMAFGTGALNISACRVPSNEGVAVIDHAPTAARGIFSGINGGTAGGYHHDGRWPANVIHDGSEAVLAEFPQASTSPPIGSMGGGSNKRSVFGTYAAQCRSNGYGDSGTAARFFYCAKASRADRNDGCDALETKLFGMSSAAVAAAARGEQYDNGDGGVNHVTAVKNNHPTVKPTDLMRYLCRLVTPPAGLVLDPFMGSGSTGRGALLEGFRFVGIERDADYTTIAAARIQAIELRKAA